MAASSLCRRHLLLSLLSLLCGLTAAREFLVGGDANAWSAPSSSQALNKWAEANRFRVGDSLVWKYDGKKDSVLQVSREDYLSCNGSAPLAVHREGNTAVELAKSGPYYFISGAEGACGRGQKLIVVVMSSSSERNHGRGVVAASPAAAAAAAESEGPAAAPASGDAAAIGRGLFLPVALAGGTLVWAMGLVL